MAAQEIEDQRPLPRAVVVPAGERDRLRAGGTRQRLAVNDTPRKRTAMQRWMSARTPTLALPVPRAHVSAGSVIRYDGDSSTLMTRVNHPFSAWTGTRCEQ